MYAKPGEPACETCKYFVQHYYKRDYSRNPFITVDFGHCMFPRTKMRRPGSAICEHYELMLSNTDS